MIEDNKKYVGLFTQSIASRLLEIEKIDMETLLGMSTIRYVQGNSVWGERVISAINNYKVNMLVYMVPKELSE